jgi:hypothetical protein
MSITTQEEALATIRATAHRIGQLTDRYDSGGAAVKAQTARDMAAAFTVLATIYGRLPKLFSGRRAGPSLVFFASADAAELNTHRAEEWSMRADADQAKADAIERQALPVFADDGMEYVPGRGRVIRPRGGQLNRHNTGATAALRALDGGQR